MKRSVICLSILLLLSQALFSQNYPTFGAEKPVTINGLSFDAMEPFISPDGSTLFFNSLNSGGNTNLYYATRIDDTTFTYVGLVNGTYDPSPNHLDAVASLDSLNNFFWTSLRSIPNLYRGNYLSGNVSNISKVYGTCNILTAGWIIMDAAVNFQGNLLYYCNAYFGPTYTECVGAPCKAKLGIAQKVNDSTYNKTTFSDAIFTNINDTNYLVYAPQVTKDGLEVYYTRLLRGGYDTEICVSVRKNVSDTFSLPLVIYSKYGFFPEAASPTTDKQKIYYHKKNGNSVYSIYLRYRTGTTGVYEQKSEEGFTIFPNPSNGEFTIKLNGKNNNDIAFVTIYDIGGKEMFQKNINLNTSSNVSLSSIPAGIYFATVVYQNQVFREKIIVH